MKYINLQQLKVSRIILGGNPFSGNSHQGSELDSLMRKFYTTDRIKATLKNAEAQGVNTLIARADAHIIRILEEYWDEGGTIQWIAQTCPEYNSHLASVTRAFAGGAKACYIHGGVMDNLLAHQKQDEIKPVIDAIKERGMVAGVAAHTPVVHQWVDQNLDVDFYMCSYYNPSSRVQSAEHANNAPEQYLENDRQNMIGIIPTLSKPAIHYKIFAAGRNNPRDAVAFAVSQMRATDAVCIGIFPKDNPNQLEEDIRLFEGFWK